MLDVCEEDLEKTIERFEYENKSLVREKEELIARIDKLRHENEILQGMVDMVHLIFGR